VDGGTNILSVQIVLDEKGNEGVMTNRMSGWKKLTMMLAHATYGMDAYPYRGQKIIRGRWLE
jgi:hypothetical protein